MPQGMGGEGAPIAMFEVESCEVVIDTPIGADGFGTSSPRADIELKKVSKGSEQSIDIEDESCGGDS